MVGGPGLGDRGKRHTQSVCRFYGWMFCKFGGVLFVHDCGADSRSDAVVCGEIASRHPPLAVCARL